MAKIKIEVESKYEIGDIVYIMFYKQIIKVKIEKITIGNDFYFSDNDETVLYYIVELNGGKHNFLEKEIFESLEGLLEHLKNNVKVES